MSKQFQCALCHGMFDDPPAEEAKAAAEAKELWGVENAREHPDFKIICDNCFNRLTPEQVKALSEEYKGGR